MKNVLRRPGILFPCLCAAATCAALAKEPIRSDAKRPVQSKRERSVATIATIGAKGMASLPQRANTVGKLKTLKVTGVRHVTAGGRVSGVLGTPVYLNEFVPAAGQGVALWEPGPLQRVADDIEIASTAGPAVSYSFAVGGFATAGASTTFTVTSSLWTGDPCRVTSTVIAGTNFTSGPLPNDGTISLVDVPLAVPVTLPSVVYMSVTFDSADVGWAVALEAEIGYTRDLFSENDTDMGFGCAQLFFGGTAFAGFWAGINANLPSPALGACCTGTACTQTTELACTGTWQGPFSSCTPNPCQTGACCLGSDFDACSDTNEADCNADGGMFIPNTLCGPNICPAQFDVYRNDRLDGRFFSQQPDATAPFLFDSLGDDMTMGPGIPCDLSTLTATVNALAFSGNYDVVMELWTIDPTNNLPLAPIPGTRREFLNLRDGATRKLVAGPYTGITLPDAVYMVLSFSTLHSGWMLGGVATIGVTQDFFVTLQNGIWNSFDFQDPTLLSAFLAEVSCYGTMPRGACCNDVAATCIDGVTLLECEGRWMQGVTCASNSFVPPCGSSACCIQFSCSDKTEADCVFFGGEFAPGRFCSDLDPVSPCPRRECTGVTGDCLLNNGTPGCQDGFCCEAVCAIDPVCCSSSYDQLCADLAAGIAICAPPPPDDNCGSAIPITGEGTFPFDNTSATTDGPPHQTCITGFGDDPQIGKDVWRCWTAPRDGIVYVRTCGNTSVDTKMAVYDGCSACPPTDANLLFCNDDFCGFDQPGGVPLQSQAVFQAVAGQSYLVRIGSFPGGGGFDPAPGGPGAITVSYDLPVVAGCPGLGDCCDALGTGSSSCTDDSCCRTVCACDAFCCEVEWDAQCATTGFGGGGCGAQALCDQTCGTGTCPVGPVNFLDPASGVVDARQPFAPDNVALKQGIGTILVEAPSALPACWSLCETAIEGRVNTINNIIDNGDGTMTIELLRPISTNAVTTLTYTDDVGGTSRGQFISHPGNGNGDGTASAGDVLALIDAVNIAGTPFNIYSQDIDHSGNRNSADILRNIDLLNGSASLPTQRGTTLPVCGTCCPP